MLKAVKPGRRYFIINIDEPYAEAVYEILKFGEMVIGNWPEGDISFEEWIELTFGKSLRGKHLQMLKDEFEGDNK